ncbi:hypothetical protein PR048_023426 [Dryococelus australis]|uniref:DUF5641 domain-containing protein n=1 Tax=Dryococelus australis TaxID=614101 RepID=A0ABQ9GU19_9NEOP|nr:hypothetical protein PR048_023426 [Dryococelus australis]
MKSREEFWPLARVEVYPGGDGNASITKVKTFSGELVRPVQRIYPLEISAPVEELKARVAHQVEKGLPALCHLRDLLGQDMAEWLKSPRN